MNMRFAMKGFRFNISFPDIRIRALYGYPTS